METGREGGRYHWKHQSLVRIKTSSQGRLAQAATEGRVTTIGVGNEDTSNYNLDGRGRTFGLQPKVYAILNPFLDFLDDNFEVNNAVV